MPFELRVAVGELHGRRSTVWKITTQGDDVYLMTRISGGRSKVSLHATGECNWSQTDEWVKQELLRNPEYRNAERHLEQWFQSRPDGVEPVIYFRLTFPHSDLSQIRTVEGKANKILWLDDPGPELAAQVTCYLTPKSETLPDLSAVGGTIHESHRLRGGHWLVVTSSVTRILGETEQRFAFQRARMLKMAQEKGFIPPGDGLSLLNNQSASISPMGGRSWRSGKVTFSAFDVSSRRRCMFFVFERTQL